MTHHRPTSRSVLLLNQFFHPSSAATSQFATDLAVYLSEEGYAVEAICGRSDYGGKNTGNLPQVAVHRVPNITFARNTMGRLISYASFYVGAAVRTFRSAPETIVTFTTPPLISAIGTMVKKLRGTRHFIWEMDVYPDVSVQLEILGQRHSLTRLIGAIADWSRHNADAIIVLGEDMKELLVARGIDAAKIFVCENWADSNEITPLPFAYGPLNVLYSGNLGLAHDVDTIQGAMLALNESERDSVHFTFCGGGVHRTALESFCAKHKVAGVSFQPYCPRALLSSRLALGHIGLVTQHRRVSGSVVPSKVYGIMAAGRPLLYIGPSGTTPARIIRKFDCGWHIEPGDVAGLVDLLNRLRSNHQLLHAPGRRARVAFLEHYDRSLGVARVASILGHRSDRMEPVSVHSAERVTSHSACS